jgi:hypothetical protein
MSTATKNPAKVRAGRASAVVRWGPEPRPPRIVNLGALTPEARRLVLALVAAAKAEQSREPEPAQERP